MRGRSPSGDYGETDASTLSQARYLFLKAVEECKPQVVIDLVDGEPGQLFKKIPSDSPLSRYWPFTQDDPRNNAFVKALRDWGAKWHLEDEWCIAQAIDYLRNSFDQDSEGDWYRGGGRIIKLASKDEMRFTFEHKGGDLARRTRADIEAEIRKAFEKRLTEYFQRMKDSAKSRGLRPVTESNRVNFEMLALYQVRGWTYDQIIDKYPRYKHRDSIARIVRKSAKLIDLTLINRQGKRGLDKHPGSRPPRKSR